MNQPAFRAAAQISKEEEEVGVGVGGGPRRMGLCFGNVNEAGNSVCLLPPSEPASGTEDVWAICARRARGAAERGRFED